MLCCAPCAELRSQQTIAHGKWEQLQKHESCENTKEVKKKKKKRHLYMCVYACWNRFRCWTFCATKHRNNSTVRQSSSSTLSLFCSLYQHCPSRRCYLKGESPHTGKFTVHLQYPFTVQSTIFLFQMKPQLPHCWFSTPLCCFFLFFPNVASLGCGFLTTHRAQEVCCGKTGPCHCFHSSLRTTELNLTPITRSQVPKILTSTYIEV